MPGHILVAEDDPDIAWVFRLRLRTGYHVTIARDLTSARSALASSAPDVVLLNLSLPDGSGLELYRDLKLDHPDLPIVFVSASPDTGHLAVQCGVDAVMLKPIDPEDVAWLMRHLLGDQLGEELPEPGCR